MENKYDVTVSSSRDESMFKAMELFMEEMETARKSRIVRPVINTKAMMIKPIMWILGIIVVGVVLYFIPFTRSFSFNLSCIILLISVIINLKRFIVSLVLLYQKYAPEEIRDACVFEPTCSNYMLMAIEKYGLIIGVIKGIKRLFRCHYPNSGVDYP